MEKFLLHLADKSTELPVAVAVICTALMLAIFVEYVANPKYNSIRYIKEWCPSVRRDIIYWLLYATGAAFVLSYFTPPGIVQAYISVYSGLTPLVNMGPRLTEFAGEMFATAMAFVVMDFVSYCAHYLMHKVPFLWKFHAVHHSATKMCIFTGNRVAFTENAFNTLLATIVGSLFGLSVGYILGLIVFKKLIDVVQHSNLNWTYGKLGFIVASPVNHFYHHSVEEADWDSNYGNIFALWDHLFGTANPKMKEINFGLSWDRRPVLGVPQNAEPFNVGFWSLPLLQDMAIWLAGMSELIKKNTFEYSNAKVKSQKRTKPFLRQK